MENWDVIRNSDPTLAYRKGIKMEHSNSSCLGSVYHIKTWWYSHQGINLDMNTKLGKIVYLVFAVTNKVLSLTLHIFVHEHQTNSVCHLHVSVWCFTSDITPKHIWILKNHIQKTPRYVMCVEVCQILYHSSIYHLFKGI